MKLSKISKISKFINHVLIVFATDIPNVLTVSSVWNCLQAST